MVFVGMVDEPLSSTGFREVKQCQQQQLAVGAVWRKMWRCGYGEVYSLGLGGRAGMHCGGARKGVAM